MFVQPRRLSPALTRLDCDTARMTWNDNANVCGSESLLAAGTIPGASAVLITIDKDTQRMTVSLDGVERYVWPVSTGQPGYSTPSGSYTARSMNEMWYSKQWDNAPMPHAVFFTREGHAIHGSSYRADSYDRPWRRGGDLGFLAKFNTPVVANGKVYVATFSKQVVVYGLLPETPPTHPWRLARMTEH